MQGHAISHVMLYFSIPPLEKRERKNVSTVLGSDLLN